MPKVLPQVRTDITPTPGFIYIIAGNTQQPCFPNLDPTCGDSTNPGSALQATFNTPTGLTVDKSDDIYIADSGDSAIRRIDASNGSISTVVGDTTHTYVGFSADGPLLTGTVAGTYLYGPNAINFDADGNLYISDANNWIIRKIDAQFENIVTVAGTLPTPWSDAASDPNGATSTGTECLAPFCGDGGSATAATLYYAEAVFADSKNDIFIVDQGTIREVNPSGNINTVAGTMAYASDGVTWPNYCTVPAAPPALSCNDGGPATSALLNIPSYVFADPTGNLLIADAGDNALRVVYGSGDKAGDINAVVGQSYPGTPTPPQNGYGGDGGIAANAQLFAPVAFAFDQGGNLYIVDQGNGLIRKVSPPSQLKPQTITFNAPTGVTYGQAPLDLDHYATVDSPLTLTYTVVSGPGTISGSSLMLTGAGTVVVTASQNGDGVTWAPATPVTVSIPVASATLTVTATNETLDVGAAIPASLPYTFSGFAPGDSQSSVVTGAPTLAVVNAQGVTLPAGTVPAAGTYGITITKGTLSAGSNYTLNLVGGILLVTENKPQTITIGSFTPPTTYGAPNSSFTFTVSASSSLPVQVTFTGPVKTQQTATGYSVTVVGAGEVTITAAQAGNTTYGPSTATQSFIVSPAVLTITANSTQTSYGVNPTYTYTATGFVAGDTSAVLSGSPAYSPTTTATLAPGQYPITLAQGTLFAQNYTINPAAGGTLTITKASQTISFPPFGFTVAYGSGQSYALQATASSGLPVEFTATGGVAIGPDGVSFVAIAAGPASITAVQAGNADYNQASVTNTFTVNQAPVTVVAQDASRPFGADNPQFTYQFQPQAPPANQYSGLPSITTTATAQSPTGTYPIVIAAGTLTSANYAFQFQNGTLTVTQPASYTLTVNPTSVTIPQGQSRQVTITLTPINNYIGSVTIGCEGLPAGVTCTASPAALTTVPNYQGEAQAITGTLTISAGQMVATTYSAESRNSRIAAAGLLYFPGLTLGACLAFQRKRLGNKPLTQCLFLVLTLVIGTACIIACGGGGSSTSKIATGTAQITVTGSGTQSPGTGNVNQSVGLTVTIEQ
ncbi:MAG: MBG domain-containing protein [Silvibacterium sp.]